jgi:hypothetical protein
MERSGTPGYTAFSLIPTHNLSRAPERSAASDLRLESSDAGGSAVPIIFKERVDGACSMF